jgi:CRP/FNR family cyclic AMP-dependent transcriptional regulator
MPVRPFTAVELFQGISESDAQRIFGLCTEKRFRRGATIFSAGEPSHCVYILKGGLVKLTSFSETGKEAILHILEPDEVFGELLLSEEKRAFTAIAVEDALVTVVSRERFLEVLLSIPTAALNFIRVLSKRLAKVEKGLAESSHTWSYHRLAKALLQLSEKYGERVPGGTLIKLRLTHEDLANLIGTTRETVTTQLNKFSRLGLVKRQARRLIVARPLLREFIRSEDPRLGNLDVG